MPFVKGLTHIYRFLLFALDFIGAALLQNITNKIVPVFGKGQKRAWVLNSFFIKVPYDTYFQIGLFSDSRSAASQKELTKKQTKKTCFEHI